MAASNFRTVYTVPGATELLFNAEGWQLLSIRCDSGGTPTIGNNPTLSPVSAGRGVVIDNTIRYFLLGPEDTLYVFSDAIDRLSVHIVNLPAWMTLLNGIGTLFSALIPKPVANAVGVALKYPGSKGTR